MKVINYGAELAPSMQNFGNALRYRNERNEAEAARQQQQETLKQAAQLYSTGTPDEIARFSIENPQVAKLLSDQIGYKDDATKQNALETMQGILTNPDRAEEFLQNRVNYLKSVGADPSETLGEIEFLRSNPEGYADIVEKAYAIKDPRGHQAYRSTLPQDKPGMSDFQKAQIGLQRDRLNLDRDRLNASRNQGEAQQSKQRTASQIKSDNAIIDDQARIESGIVSAEDGIKTVNELLSSNDMIDAISGFANLDKVPEKLRTTNQVEAQSYIENIKNTMTLKNLGVMKGPLTDKDINIIASASSRLRTGMSEKALRDELNKIKDAYGRVIQNFRKEANRKGYNQEQPEKGEGEKEKVKTLKWSDL